MLNHFILLDSGLSSHHSSRAQIPFCGCWQPPAAGFIEGRQGYTPRRQHTNHKAYRWRNRCNLSHQVKAWGIKMEQYRIWIPKKDQKMREIVHVP